MVKGKGNTPYIQFPIELIREVHCNAQGGFHRILLYGIANTLEKTREPGKGEVINNVSYWLNRKPEILTTNQVNQLERLDYFEDESLWGLDGFEPEDEVHGALEKAFQENPELYNELSKSVKCHWIFDMEGLSSKIPLTDLIKEAEQIKYAHTSNSFASANPEKVLEFTNETKPVPEIDQFACFLAIRSILGSKAYSKTNKNHILARFLGYDSIKQLSENLPTHLKAKRNKYAKRYPMDKLLDQIEANWGIIRYGKKGKRGFWIGNPAKISLESLVQQVESGDKVEQFKADKKDRIEKAKQQLKKSAF